MGCINSVPKTKKFSVHSNETFSEHQEGEDFISGLTYVRNMEWCLKASKYIEKLCFVLAAYQPEQIVVVQSTASKILSSKLAKTPAGNEFRELIKYIGDVGQFYLICMQCIRKHAARNTVCIFNDIAKYIKASIMFSTTIA
jgi:hypothetical protein